MRFVLLMMLLLLHRRHFGNPFYQACINVRYHCDGCLGNAYFSLTCRSSNCINAIFIHFCNFFAISFSKKKPPTGRASTVVLTLLYCCICGIEIYYPILCILAACPWCKSNVFFPFPLSMAVGYINTLFYTFQRIIL